MVLQFKGFEPAFLSSCKASVFDLSTDGGSAWQPPWVRMDVTPSPNQGTYLGGLLSAEGSLVIPAVASSSGVLAGVVLTLWGLAFLVGMADISSGRVMPL